jgi:hypothetical protein
MMGGANARTTGERTVYWHRELPPLDAQPIAAHTIEATSARVPGTIARRSDLWHTCYESLMAEARRRMEQEVARLGGHYAHVLDEAIDSRHDDVKGEAWLHGRFDYMLYRRPSSAETPERSGDAGPVATRTRRPGLA